MATTKTQIMSDLWLAVTPQISDDSVLDWRLLSYWVDNQRALWIRNELNKNRSIDDNLIQSLTVEFEIADRIDDNIFIQDKKILKSTKKIPVTIERHNSPTITRVGSLDLKLRPFSFVDYTSAPWAGHGKFNRNEIYAFLLNGYMYLISDCNNPRWKVIRYGNVRGVFERPEEAGNFNHEDGTACYTDDSNYPINAWILPYIKAEILKADLKQFFKPVDETNDANAINKQIVPNE